MLCVFSNSFGQTNVPAGNVSGTWTKQNSPYNIQGTITVAAGTTLTIQPGVKVLFTGRYILNVRGNLLARGTAADSIIIDQADASSLWHSIRIESVAVGSDSTIFEYCRIAHADYSGGDVTVNGGNAVLVKNFDKVRVTHCLLRNNKGGRGAGVYADHANIKINLNVIRNNSTFQYGAGIYVESGSPLIKGNRIERNYGQSAGGIHFSASGSKVEDNIISFNTSYGIGPGSVIMNSSTCVLLHNVISYNESGQDDGGGLYISNSSPQIINCTIAFNKGNSGEGVKIVGNSNPEFTNTIVYNNRDLYQNVNSIDEIYIESPAKAIFNNNDIQAGINGIGGIASLTANDNIDAVPLFKNATANDLSITWASYPVVDDAKSRCIDAGKRDSPHDADGSIADMGAKYFNQVQGKFAPRTDFVADTLLGFNTLAIPFHDRSDQGTGKITKWQWTFGDGATSTDQNPVHQYNTEGRFDVTLKIQDENGYETVLTKAKYIRMISGLYVKGIVTGTFSAPRYIVGGDLTVESTKTLEITPGVELVFLKSYALKVNGSLKAKGTAANPIVFTAYDTTGLDLPHAVIGFSQKPAGWAGIYVYASGAEDSTVIDHCKVQFVRNNGLGAIYAFCNNGAAGMRISNSEISYNSAQGISVFSSNLIIRNNYIHHNYARTYQKGAGIYFYGGTPKVINNVIAYNETASEGGGMCIDDDARPSLIGNVITNNKAARAGGICDYSGFIELINNTITFNSSTDSDGGGYYILYAGDVKFTNNIITNNTPYQIEVADGTTSVGFRNSILQGGSAGIKGYNNNVFLYDNVLTSDPMLAPQSYGRLLPGSPAVNAGTTTGITGVLPAFDLLRNARIANSVVDIGAYEYITDPTVSVANAIGDMSKDEDFDPFTVSLESVFGFQYGPQFLTYSIDNTVAATLLKVSVRDKSLYFTNVADKFGDQTVKVIASSGTSQTTTSFVVHVQSVNDPPVITVDSSPVGIRTGDKKTLSVTVSDVDNDVITLTPTATNNFFNVASSNPSQSQYSVAITGKAATSTIFSLSASDGNLVTKISIPLIVTGATMDITGLEDESLSFEPYPNPAVDYVVVRAKENSSIVLYNMNGQVVLRDKVGSGDLTLNVERLVPGLYLLCADDGVRPRTFKILKR